MLGSKIPPKNNSTPIKSSKFSTITHEEEEVQHDISILQDQVQQILLSQRVTKNEMEATMDGLKKGVEDKMDGWKNGMEANMDGVEAKMDGIEGNMEDLKKDMEGLKEGLEKLLQEKLPNGRR